MCQFAIVVAIDLLIQISEEMERFDADICPFQTTLEQAPEVFESVSVNPPVNVFLSMVNHLVREVAFQSLIGHKRVRVDRALCFDVSADIALKRMFLPIREHHGPNLTAAL